MLMNIPRAMSARPTLFRRIPSICFSFLLLELSRFTVSILRELLSLEDHREVPGVYPEEGFLGELPQGLVVAFLVVPEILYEGSEGLVLADQVAPQEFVGPFRARAGDPKGCELLHDPVRHRGGTGRGRGAVLGDECGFGGGADGEDLSQGGHGTMCPPSPRRICSCRRGISTWS